MIDSGFDQIRNHQVNDSVRKERGSPVTPRDWDSYPYIFNLKGRQREEWQGLEILDVGSGDKWENPSDVFPGARICAIDPEFGSGGRVAYNSAHECKPGVVQDIPYPNDTFDLVLSSHAIPQHIFPVDMTIAVSEMLRVMKPSGEIRLAPCVEIDVISLIESLFASGFEVIHTERGEGPITVIRAGEDAHNNLEFKKLAWHTFKELAGIDEI